MKATGTPAFPCWEKLLVSGVTPDMVESDLSRQLMVAKLQWGSDHPLVAAYRVERGFFFLHSDRLARAAREFHKALRSIDRLGYFEDVESLVRALALLGLAEVYCVCHKHHIAQSYRSMINQMIFENWLKPSSTVH